MYIFYWGVSAVGLLNRVRGPNCALQELCCIPSRELRAHVITTGTPKKKKKRKKTYQSLTRSQTPLPTHPCPPRLTSSNLSVPNMFPRTPTLQDAHRPTYQSLSNLSVTNTFSDTPSLQDSHRPTYQSLTRSHAPWPSKTHIVQPISP